MADQDSFADALAHVKPGQRVPATIANGNGHRTVTLTLGELSATEPGTM